MELFENQYRIETTRLIGRDYAEAGTYLVTMCTQGRENLFGEIRNENMVLNPIGCVVAEEILKTPMLRPNVAIDTWIVMPNHVHVIVEILPSCEMDVVETCRRHVSTDAAILVPLCRPRPRSLGAIIGHIKASATKRIWAAGYQDFRWQPRFYDSILRTERAVDNARSYVMMNPVMWHRDRNNQQPEMGVRH